MNYYSRTVLHLLTVDWILRWMILIMPTLVSKCFTIWVRSFSLFLSWFSPTTELLNHHHHSPVPKDISFVWVSSFGLRWILSRHQGELNRVTQWLMKSMHCSGIVGYYLKFIFSGRRLSNSAFKLQKLQIIIFVPEKRPTRSSFLFPGSIKLFTSTGIHSLWTLWPCEAVEAELIFSGLGSSKCLRAHREILRLLLPLNTIRWITVLLALQKYYYASKHLQWTPSLESQGHANCGRDHSLTKLFTQCLKMAQLLTEITLSLFLCFF